MSAVMKEQGEVARFTNVNSDAPINGSYTRSAPMDEVFGKPGEAGYLSKKGGHQIPVPIGTPVQDIPAGHDTTKNRLLANPVDENYVFTPEEVKNVLSSFDMAIPILIWGAHGSGKTTLIEQVCARTSRPCIRVQHTGNTEESHIIGQVHANENGTYFSAGPLPLAMKYGFTYIADEYDYADPSVTSVYQPVLEGKPLVIKEATNSEWAIVYPHPEFRFAATGNTNGTGDETRQYTGTVPGNAANYSRFGMTFHKEYPPEDVEVEILCKKTLEKFEQAKERYPTGPKPRGLAEADARKLVKLAHKIREAHEKGSMMITLGPRELIMVGVFSLRFADLHKAFELSFVNRLCQQDRETAKGFASTIL